MKKNGFTLIELIVTVSILSIFIVTAMNGFMYFFNSWTRTQVETNQLNEVRVALMHFEKDIRNAVSPEVGVAGVSTQNNGNETLIITGNPLEGYKETRYRIVVESGVARIERSVVNRGDAVGSSDWRVLVNQVQSISGLDYFSLNNKSLNINFAVSHQTGNAIQPYEVSNQYTIRSKGVMP